MFHEQGNQQAARTRPHGGKVSGLDDTMPLYGRPIVEKVLLDRRRQISLQEEGRAGAAIAGRGKNVAVELQADQRGQPFREPGAVPLAVALPDVRFYAAAQRIIVRMEVQRPLLNHRPLDHRSGGQAWKHLQLLHADF